MFRILSVATIAACLASAASAATVTMYFEIDNITMSTGAEEALGFAVTTVSGSVSWDDAYSNGPDGYLINYSDSQFVYDLARDSAPSAYTWDFGFTQIDQDSGVVTSDAVSVRDGISNGTSEISDGWFFYSTDVLDGLDGVTSSQASLSVVDSDLGALSGLSPTAADLNGFEQTEFTTAFQIDGQFYYLRSTDITFSNTPPSAVPLPSAGWLLLAGLGALGIGRRRRHCVAGRRECTSDVI